LDEKRGRNKDGFRAGEAGVSREGRIELELRD